MINFKRPLENDVILHAGDEMVIYVKRQQTAKTEQIQLFSATLEQSVAINSVAAMDFGPDSKSFDMNKGVVLVVGFTPKVQI